MMKNKALKLLLFLRNNHQHHLSRRKNGAGFTLAEVLIVVAIILLLFPMVITNYNVGEKQFSLYRSAHSFAQDLRNTQEMAMTGELTPVQFGQNFPKGGYGLYFKTNTNSYILFADCDGDNEYDPSGTATSCLEAGSAPGESYPEQIREISLEPGVIISDIIPTSPINIVFFPPVPVITINPLPADNQVIISLTLAGKTKTITINNVGLIDVD
ncbi:MAG: Tfp pilus assembly protein FimT/FimU [Candidatus Nealsonbacteria bacterium]